MPEISEAELKKQLDKNEIKNLYFLYGEENYMVKRSAKRLIKKAAGTDFPEFNLNEFPGTAGVDKISDAVEALPLMSMSKCVAVSDFNVEEKDATELSKLEELISNVPESTTLIFYYPTLSRAAMGTAKFKKVIKAVQKNGFVTEFKPRGAKDLEKLLMRDAEKNGVVLSKQNAAKLVEYVGTDLKSLLSENAKLCAFAAGGEITSEIIENMVPKSIETTVFMLSNALLAGKYEQAYRYIDDLFKTKAEPISIVAVLGSSYTDMYRVRSSVESGLGLNGPLVYGEYKGKEFRLSKADRSAKGVSTEVLSESLDIILETDLALKGSKLSPRILIDEMIAKLLLAARGERL